MGNPVQGSPPPFTAACCGQRQQAFPGSTDCFPGWSATIPLSPCHRNLRANLDCSVPCSGSAGPGTAGTDEFPELCTQRIVIGQRGCSEASSRHVIRFEVRQCYTFADLPLYWYRRYSGANGYQLPLQPRAPVMGEPRMAETRSLWSGNRGRDWAWWLARQANASAIRV
jgi:hypothetical protein